MPDFFGSNSGSVNFSEFANLNLSEIQYLQLITKYNRGGQIDDYLNYYFTYAQYFMFLDNNAISNRKVWRWKDFVFKDFNDQYGLNKFKNFIQMFEYETKHFSYNLWKLMFTNKEKYFLNDVVARFEKEYALTDFAAERHAKCATPLLDKLCARFGEEKGNNLCAAVFSYVELQKTVEKYSSDKDLCRALWKDHCQNQMKRMFGEQGLIEFNEAVEIAKPIEELEKEVLALNAIEYTCIAWMHTFKNSHFI